MEDTKKSIKIFSILFIVLAVVGVLTTILSFTSSDINGAAAEAGVAEGTVKVLIGISVVYSLIIAAVQLYLGVKGLMQVKGSIKGYGHITVATIALVVICISLVLSVIGGFMAGFDWEDIIQQVAAIAILLEYKKFVKQLKDN